MARVRGKMFWYKPFASSQKCIIRTSQYSKKEYYEEGCKKVTDSMRTPVRNTEKREWGEWKSGKKRY